MTDPVKPKPDGPAHTKQKRKPARTTKRPGKHSPWTWAKVAGTAVVGVVVIVALYMGLRGGDLCVDDCCTPATATIKTEGDFERVAKSMGNQLKVSGSVGYESLVSEEAKDLRVCDGLICVAQKRVFPDAGAVAKLSCSRYLKAERCGNPDGIERDKIDEYFNYCVRQLNAEKFLAAQQTKRASVGTGEYSDPRPIIHVGALGPLAKFMERTPVNFERLALRFDPKHADELRNFYVDYRFDFTYRRLLERICAGDETQCLMCEWSDAASVPTITISAKGPLKTFKHPDGGSFSRCQSTGK